MIERKLCCICCCCCCCVSVGTSGEGGGGGDGIGGGNGGADGGFGDGDGSGFDCCFCCCTNALAGSVGTPCSGSSRSSGSGFALPSVASSFGGACSSCRLIKNAIWAFAQSVPDMPGGHRKGAGNGHFGTVSATGTISGGSTVSGTATNVAGRKKGDAAFRLTDGAAGLSVVVECLVVVEEVE